MPSADPSTPFSIKSKPISISLGSKIKVNSKLGQTNGSAHQPPSSSSSSSKKRPHSALADPDSDNEESTSRVETVTGFDSGKAVSKDQTNITKTPLVIKAEKNRDWREGSRKKRSKNLLPAEVQRAAQNGDQSRPNREDGDADRVEVSKEGGLNFGVRKDADGDVPMSETNATATTDLQDRPQTADEEAIAALLGTEKKSTLTIPTQDGDSGGGSGADAFDNSGFENDTFTNEDAKFRADVASRPDPASLADYAAIPVEEIGAALLRGMGWKEGEAIGKRRNQANIGGTKPSAIKPKETKRRPALLGIGAKETPGDSSTTELDLGAWGTGAGAKKGGGKRGGKQEGYNPVMLRNADTGEMITEQELELRRTEAKLGKTVGGAGKDEQDWRDRRDRNLMIDDRKKKDKDKDRFSSREEENDMNGERSRYSSSSKRERSRDREKDKHHARDQDRDRDRDSYRERDKDRDRERKKDHGSSRRERSRSGDRNGHSSSKRYRSRSRDRGSSRRERSRPADGRQRKKEREYDRRDRDYRRH